jgi:LysM repeat protein
MRIYVAKSGDSLLKISQVYKIELEKLLTLTHLKSHDEYYWL